jgi:sortase (surface protein transpeptidase)
MMTERQDDPTGEAATAGASRLDRRRFIRAAGATAGAAALGSAIPSGLVEASVPAGAASFVPLPKGVRLADTRYPDQFPFTRIAPNHIRVQVRDRAGVPPEATAVVLTVTAKNRDTVNNYVTVFPTDAGGIPEASNLNLPRPNEVTANLAFVRVGSQDSVDVFQYGACESIVDILGYFVSVTAATRRGRFVGLPAARRAVDTRPNFVAAGSFTTVDVTPYVPGEAASVVINLTSLANPGGGFFSAVPHSVATEPTTSSLNVFFPNDKRAAAVIVPVESVGGRRLIKIYASTSAKLIVDVTGYFTNDEAPSSQVGLFVPTDPTRVLDTRKPDPTKRMWPQWVVEQTLPAPASTAAAAVVLNVTSARTRGEGYLTVSGARLPIPETSNVNWVGPGAIVPNLAITPVTATHGFQVFNFSGGHVIADMAGYFTGQQRIAVLPPYVNPPPPAAAPEWTLRIPRLGLTSRVLPGDPVFITDSGHSWHWAGTGFMGQAAHVAVFGHRTEAGSPYRYLHFMQPGDTWTVTTLDGREFTYRMVRRDLTDAQTGNILNATRFHPGTTFSIVACTRGYDSAGYRRNLQWFEPTSLKYRLVVTGELVSWREF